MCSSNERIGDPNSIARGRTLHQLVALERLDERNSNCAYPRAVEVSQRLLHDVRCGKGCIVVNRENKWSCRESGPMVTLDDISVRGVGADQLHSWKPGTHGFSGPIGGTVIHHKNF